MTDDRCKHEILPGQCSLCQGLEEPNPYEGVLIERFYQSAKYRATCALFSEHIIHEGSQFALAVHDNAEGRPPFDRIGYVCNRCTRKVTGDA